MTCTTSLPTICIKKGTDRTFTITITNSDTGEPINILNYEIHFTIRKRDTLSDSDDTNLLVDKTANITDPTNGLAEFSLTKTDTDLDVGDYIYEISYQKPDDTIISHYGYWSLLIQYLSHKTRA